MLLCFLVGDGNRTKGKVEVIGRTQRGQRKEGRKIFQTETVGIEEQRNGRGGGRQRREQILSKERNENGENTIMPFSRLARAMDVSHLAQPHLVSSHLVETG